MQRKTNLFYFSGPDSKFLTFSNYTESLTGNFLSTNTKIYPSMFLCMYVPGLDNTNNIGTFIKTYLAGYYENKLATLRDNCILNDKNPEDYLNPLGYLIDAIKKYSKNSEITYIGDITEQDYNGTYTDTICTISFSNAKKGAINPSPERATYSSEFINCDEHNLLYGWTQEELPDGYKTRTPIFDEEYKYYFDPKFQNIKISSLGDVDSIKFNIIIPLFDITNINYHTQHYVNENIELDNNNELVINLNGAKLYDNYRKNVPLGIWFANQNIVLKKDKNTNFSQSWSLMISSQFKPFPYAYKDPNKIVENSSSNAFPTFAMVLSKQNEILDMFNKVSKQLSDQQQQILSLQDQINNKSSDLNIDKLQNKFIDFEYLITKKYNKLEEKVKQYMDNLAWKAAE